MVNILTMFENIKEEWVKKKENKIELKFFKTKKIQHNIVLSRPWMANQVQFHATFLSV